MSDMNPRDYVVWLQGMYEMIGDRQPTEAEWAMLRSAHKMQFGKVIIQDLSEAIAQDAKFALIQKPKADHDAAIQKMKQAYALGPLPAMTNTITC